MELVITCLGCGNELTVREGIASFHWQIQPCECVVDAAYERGKAEADDAAEAAAHQDSYDEGYAAGHRDAINEIQEAAGKLAAAGNGKGGWLRGD